MNRDVVITLTGPDRIGIVEEVTSALLAVGANVESSRMARLGGEFAVLLLASLPAEKVAEVEPALASLTSAGYKATVSPTEAARAEHPDWLTYHVEVEGADHEGIIHEIAAGLAQLGINIEAVETGTSRAPVTGTTLFTMKAVVAVPPEVAEAGWIGGMVEAARNANVDVTVSPAD